MPSFLLRLRSSRLTLPARSGPIITPSFPLVAYNAFIRYGSSSSWCRQHALNFRALSRAVSIRSQLKKYMQRFGLTPLQSCEGDAKRLRRCIVSGFWKNAARFVESEGTFRGVRGEGVSAPLGFLWVRCASAVRSNDPMRERCYQSHIECPQTRMH